jgi:hypothetical protein
MKRRLAASVLALALISAAAPSWTVRLDPPGEPGIPFELSGRVLLRPGGPPARGVKVYAYHADASGHYGLHGEREPRLAGTLHTNVLGEYKIRTILPGRYGGEPHFHMRIYGPDDQVRALTLGFLRPRGAGSDSGLAKLSQMIEMPKEGFNAYVNRDDDGVLKARYDILLSRLTGTGSSRDRTP